MTPILLKTSLRHLLRHPWQVGLAILGVALGVAVVVSIDLTNSSAQPKQPAHHKVVSLKVTGGFLGGAKLEFADGLNCLIGGRGTGKTTAWLERISRERGSRSRCRDRSPLLSSGHPARVGWIAGPRIFGIVPSRGEATLAG